MQAMARLNEREKNQQIKKMRQTAVDLDHQSFD